MIVIVDTNLARNENSFSRLLGNRSQLEKIAATARLIIPEVVIDEIVAQKRLAFQKELAALRRSGVLKLTVSPEEVLGSLSFDNIERKIRNDKSIPYTPLPLPPANYVLPKLYEWALSHKAPFEEKATRALKTPALSRLLNITWKAPRLTKGSYCAPTTTEWHLILKGAKISGLKTTSARQPERKSQILSQRIWAWWKSRDQKRRWSSFR